MSQMFQNFVSFHMCTWKLIQWKTHQKTTKRVKKNLLHMKQQQTSINIYKFISHVFPFSTHE
jgi:hypothetical protein